MFRQQTKETRQVLCAAPFIGVVPGREGQLQQLVGRDESAGAPITGLIDRALASVTEQLSGESAVAAQQSSRGSRIAGEFVDCFLVSRKCSEMITRTFWSV